MENKPETLLRKYDVPVPRYTSYPTVPFWDSTSFSVSAWQQAVIRCFHESNSSKGISLYIHLPFCESLCTYCACNTRITHNHKVEEQYIESIHREWRLYTSLWQETPVLRELHLGGGTPTFFSPANLLKLLLPILQSVSIHPQHSFSVEGHPNNTTREHLRVLARLGFNRVSFGVQDLDAKVQQAIHRIQPLENLRQVTQASRQEGYASVSFDLIYGLPFQTQGSVCKTVEQVIRLKPDRIAFYSYAHVPWLKPGQRGYDDGNLPTDVEKRGLYEAGRALFLEAGYVDVGMDHFSLPGDSLAMAKREGTLHRNFMGYTTTPTDLLIGLGASAISDARYAYAQNEKHVETYQGKVAAGELAVIKGHLQSIDDQVIRRIILDIACKEKVMAERLQKAYQLDDAILAKLKIMEAEGVVSLQHNALQVTRLGRAFVRNICQVFDLRMRTGSAERKVSFSRAI
jgi:oxygen-independent coproporphyrinogen-3 oxidase